MAAAASAMAEGGSVALTCNPSRSLLPRSFFRPQTVKPWQISSHRRGRIKTKLIFGAKSSLSDPQPICGNQKMTSVTPQLYQYLLDHIREPQILRELREETSAMQGSGMQVAPDQAQLLAMLVQILGAEQCIEVGVYTGYSSLATALALPESGRLVACDRDESYLDVAKRYYERAGVRHKVDVRHGLALDILKDLLHNGEACRYDFAFLDADKRLYSDYYELLLQLIRSGGVIAIDNVLWGGKVADPLVDDKRTSSLREFNRVILHDQRVSISIIPIGDGMTLCRKR